MKSSSIIPSDLHQSVKPSDSRHLKHLQYKSQSLNLLLSHLSTRFDHLSMTLLSTKHQLQSLSLEKSQIIESIQDCKSQLSPSSLQEILKIKNPNTALVLFSETFLKFFQVINPSWPVFKGILKDYEKFERTIIRFEDNFIEQQERNRYLNWKKQENKEKIEIGINYLRSFNETSGKLKKYPKAVKVLRGFLKATVEKTLNEMAFEDYCEEFLRYKNKAIDTKSRISELALKVFVIEEKIQELKRKNLDERGKDWGGEDFDYMSPSLCSPIFTQKVKVSFNALTNGTASGGLLTASKSLVEEISKIDEGQNDEYFHRNPSNESFSLHFESNEKLGCCRTNLFCFP